MLGETLFSIGRRLGTTHHRLPREYVLQNKFFLTEAESSSHLPEPPGDGKNSSAAAAALMFAKSCRAKLEERVASLPDIEEKALEALALLTRR
jgi:hypothetical protein